MKVAKDPILNDFHKWLGDHIANAPSEEAIEAVEDFEELMEFMWKESAKFYQKELEQQKFNNKYNLSIDQQIADEMVSIRHRLEKAEDLISRIGQDNSPPWDSLDARGLCFKYLNEEN